MEHHPLRLQLYRHECLSGLTPFLQIFDDTSMPDFVHFLQMCLVPLFEGSECHNNINTSNKISWRSAEKILKLFKVKDDYCGASISG